MLCISCDLSPTDNGGWVANLEEKQAGPYWTQDIAIRVAIAEALRLRAAARPARVTVRDRSGTIRVERCLCIGFKGARVS